MMFQFTKAVPVPLQRLEDGHHRCVMPAAAFAGRWCDLRIKHVPTGCGTIVIVRLKDLAGIPDPWMGAVLSYSGGAVFGVPEDAAALRVDVFGLPDAAGMFAVFGTMSRAAAAFRLLAQSPSRALSLFRHMDGTPAQRLRSLLAALAAGRSRWLEYTVWHRVFDCWNEADRQRLFASPDRANWPGIGVLIDPAGAGEAALLATQNALRRQWLACPETVLSPGGLQHPAEAYVAVVQAGESLPPHALCVFADQAAKAGFPAALYADDDEIGPDLVRRNPHFKPAAGPLSLGSGLLTRGVWMFRRDVLVAWGDGKVSIAGTLRLALALQVVGGKEPCLHIPFVLSHRHTGMVRDHAEDLRLLVEAFFASRQFPAVIDAAALPLRVRPDIAHLQENGDPPKISIIIPTTAQAPHVASCLAGILQHTSYPCFEVVLVVSQAGPLDAAQERVLAPLRAHGNVRVALLAVPAFSFSRAINAGAAVGDGALLCLLNDDIVPLQDDWLWTLVGHLRDPDVAIAGPKLLYPDGTVQHGGVIMGLGGGCAHAHRLLPEDAPGYAYRACLDQDLSCVTGACLLVRRDVYDALDGLDERFPIAFNDIDFCLRAREAGWRVIYAASTTLLHYETISLGSHYEGERHGLQVDELRRLHQRWQATVSADPFHNPNLSLQMGHEWDVELPPRLAKPFGVARQAPL